MTFYSVPRKKANKKKTKKNLKNKSKTKSKTPQCWLFPLTTEFSNRIAEGLFFFLFFFLIISHFSISKPSSFLDHSTNSSESYAKEYVKQDIKCRSHASFKNPAKSMQIVYFHNNILIKN